MIIIPLYYDWNYFYLFLPVYFLFITLSLYLLQGVLTFLAVQKYRLGASEAFTSGYEPEANVSSPYSSFPGSETGDPYQQPPFSAQKEAPDFQTPTY